MQQDTKRTTDAEPLPTRTPAEIIAENALALIARRTDDPNVHGIAYRAMIAIAKMRAGR